MIHRYGSVADGAHLEVSGAVRASGAIITGDVNGAVHLVDGKYLLDLTGDLTYRKGKLSVSGTVTTHMDIGSQLGQLRIQSRTTLGSISGNVDINLSRPVGGDPVFADLTITNIQLVKGISVDVLHLGNSAAAPTTVSIDAQLTVPKILNKDEVIRGVGSLNTADGSFDFALGGERTSSPWLALFFRYNTSASVHLVGTPQEVRLQAGVSLGVVVPALGSAAGGSAILNASLVPQTGAISASLDVHAAACVLLRAG